ncbi:MAG: hypothetical protein F4X92_02975 [Gammaproteobacteria bacterium]|nr:hypothetical protein [Gammaproteobacteria bacterium]
MRIHKQNILKRTSRLLMTGIFLILIGCGGGAAVNQDYESTSAANQVGPAASTSKAGTTEKTSELRPLEIAVLLFDPNIPENPADLEKFEIWPELRRVESNRFALNLKASLQDTNAVGRVRVVPGNDATSDLYVAGKILKSNGEDVEIHVTCKDISGRKWCDKKFKHRVHESFYRDLRNKGKDAYEPVFVAAADYIIEKLRKSDAAYLRGLPTLKEIRFGNSISTETFAKYLDYKARHVELASLPASNDPMLKRIRNIRIQDQLFVDRLQAQFEDFNYQVDDSYRVWQEQSLHDVRTARELRRKAQGKKFLGALLLLGAAVGAANADSSAEEVATAAALVGGAMTLSQGFQNSNEAKFHRDSINEIGQTADSAVAPHVIRFEEETKELKGTADEQYRQWIELLREIYLLEETPQVQL